MSAGRFTSDSLNRMTNYRGLGPSSQLSRTESIGSQSRVARGMISSGGLRGTAISRGGAEIGILEAESEQARHALLREAIRESVTGRSLGDSDQSTHSRTTRVPAGGRDRGGGDEPGWSSQGQLAALAANQHLRWNRGSESNSSGDSRHLLNYAAALANEGPSAGRGGGMRPSREQQSMASQRRLHSSSAARRSRMVDEASSRAMDAQGSGAGGSILGNTNLRDNATATAIARKLLGYVPVEKGEPPIVLSPGMMEDVSDRIQMIVNRLVAIAGESTAADRDRDNSRDSGAEWKAFAKEQAMKVCELESKLKSLQGEKYELKEVLKKRGHEIERLRRPKTDDNNGPTNRLIMKQKQEIEALRAVLCKDAEDIGKKNAEIGKLNRELERTGGSKRKRSHGSDDQLVKALEKEVETLTRALQEEKANSQKTTRAYMKAAVHALKKQRVAYSTASTASSNNS